jgi:hypothetical protein
MVVLSVAYGQQAGLRRDGFYYTVEKTGGKVYEGVMEPARTWIKYWFFYEDGSFAGVGSSPVQNDSTVGPEYFGRRMDSLRIIFSNRDFITHGRYVVRGDTIQITSLSLKSSGFGNMGKVEFFVRVVNPERLSFFSEYCKWCKGDIRGFLESAWRKYEPPVAYRFFPFGVKPDSVLSKKAKRMLAE